MGRTIATNSLEVIQNYEGEELTAKVVERLANVPAKRLVGLFQELKSLYDGWLDHERWLRTDDDVRDVYLCIPEWTPGWSWQRTLDHAKNATLFFPCASVPDPIASRNLPPISLAEGFDLLDDQTVADFIDPRRGDFRESLVHLLELAPLIKGGDLLLFPVTFALETPELERAVADEMNQLTRDRIAGYGPGVDERDIERIKRFGHACAACRYHPIAGSDFTKRVLDKEYENAAGVANVNHTVNAALLRYDLPGASKIPVADLVRLRRDDEAFAIWRSNFGAVVRQAVAEASDDQGKFEVELRQAAGERLEPAVKAMEAQTKNSPFWSAAIAPAVTLLGGVATWMTTTSFPLTIAFGTVGAAAGWAAESLRRRLSRPNCSATVMRQFYGAVHG